MFAPRLFARRLFPGRLFPPATGRLPILLGKMGVVQFADAVTGALEVLYLTMARVSLVEVEFAPGAEFSTAGLMSMELIDDSASLDLASVGAVSDGSPETPIAPRLPETISVDLSSADVQEVPARVRVTEDLSSAGEATLDNTGR